MTQGSPPDPQDRRSARFWFDFVDPISYLLELELCAVESSFAVHVERVGYELVVPPGSLTVIGHPAWVRRFASARHEADDVTLAPPGLVPWTRKAHELHLHAQRVGKGNEVRLAIYRAYFERSEDIGRIDRLVALADTCGLDPATAHTVLGVDGHEADVLAVRAAATAEGVRDVPTLGWEGRLHQGFHNRAALLTLFQSAS